MEPSLSYLPLRNEASSSSPFSSSSSSSSSSPLVSSSSHSPPPSAAASSSPSSSPSSSSLLSSSFVVAMAVTKCPRTLYLQASSQDVVPPPVIRKWLPYFSCRRFRISLKLLMGRSILHLNLAEQPGKKATTIAAIEKEEVGDLLQNKKHKKKKEKEKEEMPEMSKPSLRLKEEEKSENIIGEYSTGVPISLRPIVTQRKRESYIKGELSPPKDLQRATISSSAFMKDASTEMTPCVSWRDMGTQMTPITSSLTSLCTTPMNSHSPALHNTPTHHSPYKERENMKLKLEFNTSHLAKLKLRPQQVYPLSKSPLYSERSSRSSEPEIVRSSHCFPHGDHELKKPSCNISTRQVKKSAIEIRAAAWEEAERAEFAAKYDQQEAKIDEWENLQKAKAKAKLKKLEVKLEKSRARATRKIIEKLAVAQKRAEEMRELAQAQYVEHVNKTIDRVTQIQKTSHNLPIFFGRFSYESSAY